MSGRVPKGILRKRVSDFKVREVLDIELADDGEHLFLLIEKTDMNTQDVQKLLADHYGVTRLDVGYAGLKDKRAVARQWFSLRQPKRARTPKHPNFKVLRERRHTHKLRVGDHSANAFNIVVRETDPEARLFAEQAFSKPFPNYFGLQRFGRNFSNLQRAREWVKSGREKTSRIVRARHMSTLRSFVFNEVLAKRVTEGSWNSLLRGDCGAASGPTGPLWGRGRLPTTDDVRVVEESVREQNVEVCDALEWVGLRQERRALSARTSDVEVDGSKSTVELSFVLPPGCYATVAIGECFEIEEGLA